MIITIPNERPISWNQLYSGRHHSIRTREKNRVTQLVRAAIDPDWPMFTNRVDVWVTAYFDKRPLDPDNIPDKFYIDALCGWLFADDTYKQIRWTATRSEVDKNNPRLEIEINEVR